MLRLAAILLHLHKVQGTVQAATNLLVVNGEGEFPVLEVEEFVAIFILHQIHTRSNICGIWPFCDEAQGQFRSFGVHTVSVVVLLVSSINHTILCACFGIWAKALVPKIASVAIGCLTLDMSPSPICINDNFCIVLLAASRVAETVWQFGVNFLGEITCQLGCCHREACQHNDLHCSRKKNWKQNK